jgi:hypothetical protein
MQATQIDQTIFDPTECAYWIRRQTIPQRADLLAYGKFQSTHYQDVDLDRLVIHRLEILRKGVGNGRSFVKSLQLQYEEIHIFPVEVEGFWEKCGFLRDPELPWLMTWSRTAN